MYATSSARYESRVFRFDVNRRLLARDRVRARLDRTASRIESRAIPGRRGAMRVKSRRRVTRERSCASHSREVERLKYVSFDRSFDARAFVRVRDD